MNLKTRRIVFLFFLLIFLLVSPLLIISALGYKYNFKKHCLEKTGVFFVKSFPRGAAVYLDGEKFKKNTPTQITRLLPNSYKVEIAKKDYRPWQKNLTIQPNLTTFIEDVSLIYQTPKWTTILKGDFIDFLAAPSEQEQALIEQTAETKIVWLYNLDSDSFTKLFQAKTGSKLKLIAWSASNKKLLLKENKDYLVFNIEVPDVFISLTKISKVDLTEVKWDETNDNLIYGLNGDRLIKINLLEKQVSLITQDKIINYFPYKTKIIAIFKYKEKYYLKIYGNAEPQILFSLPASLNYQFAAAGSNNLLLFDPNQQQLYLLEPEKINQPVTSMLKNSLGFKWHNKQLIYWNNAELFAFYPAAGKSILLERSSEKISNAFWHPNAVYIYAVIGGKLKLYELDGRGQRNIYEILEVQEGQENFLATNKKGDYLYLITTANDLKGFYKIEIQWLLFNFFNH